MSEVSNLSILEQAIKDRYTELKDSMHYETEPDENVKQVIRVRVKIGDKELAVRRVTYSVYGNGDAREGQINIEVDPTELS